MLVKVWKKYEKYLLTGEWHIHTNYTDGKNTVFEICKKAIELNIPLVAFTEHVRRKLSYDFNKFISDIEKAREEFRELIILSGLETKVLPNCSLDVEKFLLKEVDFRILAFHSFPKDLTLYVYCLKRIFESETIDAWAHPGLFLRKTKLELDEKNILEILCLMKNKDILLEINKKHRLPKQEWIRLALKIGVKFVRGNDIHSLEDFNKLTLDNFKFL